LQLPESGYKNDVGDTLYSFSEIYDHVTHYIQSRHGLWALDLLSVPFFSVPFAHFSGQKGG